MKPLRSSPFVSTIACAVVCALLCLVPRARAQLPNAWQIYDGSSTASLYYSTNLSAAAQEAATNQTGGWSLTVNGRFVTDFNLGAGNQTMFMTYGDGTKSWEILWSLNNGDLQSYLYDTGGTFLVTAGGTGTNLYHTHQIIYDPTNQTASYLVDGQLLVTNWTGSAAAWPTGEVAWGAVSSSAGGEMNFHSVSFQVTNGVVAAYDAGTESNPTNAPDPETQGWALNPSVPPVNTAANSVSPDTALLPEAITLAADQFTANSGRLNGQVNPSGSPTTAWFEWGTNLTYGNTTSPQDVGQGILNSNLSATLSGLIGGPDYHYRTVASNEFGVVAGGDLAFSLSFRPTVTSLPGVFGGSVAWADYDRDGLLDLLLTGNTGSSSLSQLWRNTGSGFTNAPIAGLPGVYAGSCAWADYDRDGWPDFLVTGRTNATSRIIQLWRNTGSGFTNVPMTGLPAVESGAGAWADYDNDGRPDILLTGTVNGDFSGSICQLWRNVGGGFTNVPIAGLPGVLGGADSAAWTDYDNDGRPDFLITGITNRSFGGLSGILGVSQLWRNTGNGFTNVPVPGLPQVEYGSVAWGDYDNDGRLDFLLTGTTNGDFPGSISQLWRNTGSGFTNVPIAGLPGVFEGSAAWGDFDNDGRLDFLLTGITNGIQVAPTSQLWRNTGTGFALVPLAELTRIASGSIAWCDYDHDGRLDFVLTGETNTSSGAISQIWRNHLTSSNTVPAAPSALVSSVSSDQVQVHWDPATDAQTPSAGLTYNLRVGTTPGGDDVVSPEAEANGFRLLPAPGDAQMRTNALLTDLTPGTTYYWSVQAVDTAFAGGPFAPEATFVAPPAALSIARTNKDVTISWRPPYPGLLLQESSSLHPAAWTNSSTGSTNPVVVPVAQPTRFYRLFKP